MSTNTLSKYLKTTPASVTDMLKKLKEKGLVEYRPYKGVTLSPEGEKIALKIIQNQLHMSFRALMTPSQRRPILPAFHAEV